MISNLNAQLLFPKYPARTAKEEADPRNEFKIAVVDQHLPFV